MTRGRVNQVTIIAMVETLFSLKSCAHHPKEEWSLPPPLFLPLIPCSPQEEYLWHFFGVLFSSVFVSVFRPFVFVSRSSLFFALLFEANMR